MRLVMLAHAGFLVETTVGKLVMDPWLTGRAFGDSWDLLEPAYCPSGFWSDVRWIWFSHEHPDHFHPPSLLSISANDRNHITILFQFTRDKKLLSWMSEHGFKVQECKNQQQTFLGKNTTIKITKNGLYDSWLYIEDDVTMLNLNDCAISTLTDCHSVDKIVSSPIDVMITQFSYASWPGNPDDTEQQRTTANSILTKLENQTSNLKPKCVIPAASFVWFSHDENYWMNSQRVSIERAVTSISDTGVCPVVLQPGESWDIGTSHDNDGSLKHYQTIFDVDGRELHTSTSIDKEKVLEVAAQLITKIKASNNLFILGIAKYCAGLFRPIVFYVSDLNVYLELDPLKELKILDGAPVKYVSLHSESLFQTLSSAWGIDTLAISGRFSCVNCDLRDLNNSLSIMKLNSAGIFLQWRYLPRIVVENTSVAINWLTWMRERKTTR